MGTGAVLLRLTRLPHSRSSSGDEQQKKEADRDAGLLPLLPSAAAAGLPVARPQHRDGQKPRRGAGCGKDGGGGD